MIALIFKKKKKIGEILQNGEVFSVKITDPDSIEGSYLKDVVRYSKENTQTIFDTTSTPGSAILCRLGRSELETFLILERGLPGLNVELSNGLRKKNAFGEGRVS